MRDGSKGEIRFCIKIDRVLISSDLSKAAKATKTVVSGVNLLFSLTVCCKAMTFRRVVKFYFMILLIKRHM